MFDNMKILLVFVLFYDVVLCAKILGWFPCPSISHQKIFRPVWKELSLRGHEVTIITPDPLKDATLKNLTEIDVSFTYSLWNELDISHLRREFVSAFTMQYYFHLILTRSVEMVAELEEFKKIISKENTEKYDLILVEVHNLIPYGLSHRFDAPLIAISSLGLNNYQENLFGNSIHPALYPDFVPGYFAPLTFWEKIDHFYVIIGSYLYHRYYLVPSLDEIARKYFGNDMPYLDDIFRNSSIIFKNINPIFSDRRPTAPNVMSFSFPQTARIEDIHEDLKKILDDSTNGVVYFSLGTNVRFGHLEGDFKGKMLEALGDLPYTVLCKWESEDYPNKPKNVVLRKFFPQQSILSHRNIKLFVTQGGLQSSEEAISNGVPLVVIPFLGDQPMNARILTGHGMAETISPKDLTKENLRDTIMKVANDEKYRLKAQELRNIFLDQPESGIDKIVWWCEYVMRHKGAKHLRSPSADIPLYEYFMLDVFAVLFAALFVFYKLARFVLPKIFTLSGFCKKDKTKLKKH